MERTNNQVSFWSVHFRKSYLFPLLVSASIWAVAKLPNVVTLYFDVRENSRELSRIESKIDVLESRVIELRETEATQNEAIRKIEEDRGRGRD